MRLQSSPKLNILEYLFCDHDELDFLAELNQIGKSNSAVVVQSQLSLRIVRGRSNLQEIAKWPLGRLVRPGWLHPGYRGETHLFWMVGWLGGKVVPDWCYVVCLANPGERVRIRGFEYVLCSRNHTDVEGHISRRKTPSGAGIFRFRKVSMSNKN